MKCIPLSLVSLLVVCSGAVAAPKLDLNAKPVINAEATAVTDAVKAESAATADALKAEADAAAAKAQAEMDAAKAQADALAAQAQAEADAAKAQLEAAAAKALAEAEALKASLLSKQATQEKSVAVTAEPTVKTESPKKSTNSKSSGSVSISNLEICTAIDNKTPAGSSESFGSETAKLYCFTRVIGAKDSTAIKHAWYCNGQLVSKKSLTVVSANWRTWSAKAITPDMKGSWRVDVIAADRNTVLASKEFTIQ